MKLFNKAEMPLNKKKNPKIIITNMNVKTCITVMAVKIMMLIIMLIFYFSLNFNNSIISCVSFAIIH